MNKTRAFFSAMMVVFFLGGSQLAHAHKVNLFAYAEEGEVYVEGYFVDGKRALNSNVKVFNASGELLVEGTTDDSGIYRFAIPEKSDLKITLNAGMGHKGEFSLAADELGSEPVAIANEAAHNHGPDTHKHDDTQGAHDHADTHAHDDHSDNTHSQAPGSPEIEKMVRKAVNEAIKPLVRELEESQQKASLSGIVGGVGYIIGFLGLFAYMTARKEAAKNEK